MKINVEVDCTPEEARRLFGLPDLTPLHAIYLSRVEKLMEKGITPDLVESMVKNWVPMGEAGMGLVQSLLGQFGGGKRALIVVSEPPTRSTCVSTRAGPSSGVPCLTIPCPRPASISEMRPGERARLFSHTTPRRSRNATASLPILVYFERPCARGRWPRPGRRARAGSTSPPRSGCARSWTIAR